MRWLEGDFDLLLFLNLTSERCVCDLATYIPTPSSDTETANERTESETRSPNLR